MLETIEKYATRNNCEKIEAVNHALNEGLKVFWYKGVVERVQIFNADEINWSHKYGSVFVAIPNIDKTNDTVFGHDEEGNPCLYKDLGWYSGTIEEYNVRRVEEVTTFRFIAWNNPILKSIHGDAYGSRWGGGMSALFEISPPQIESLQQENKRIKEKNEQDEKEHQEKIEMERLAIFEKAKATGEPVFVRSYITECDGTESECSTDVISIYAMPDGTVSKTRQHTW